MNMTEEEKDLLRQYQALPDSKLRLANRVAVEVAPPAIFVALGLITGEVIWYVAVIVLMVAYNVQRVLRQYKNIATLRSISKKVVGEVGQGPKA